jgi:cytochrome c oxidase assembly protein subunit 15
MKMIADNKISSLVHRPVRVWLFIGVFMVFMQVVIGGITRLTDSGLSITEWAVIQGTMPPTNVVEWEQAFTEYQVMAKKQFETLHADMTLSEFKVIYFWEYFHRLWARTMGFVFIFPFIFFLWKRGSYQRLLKRLGITGNAPPKDEEHLRWMPTWTMKWLGVVIGNLSRYFWLDNGCEWTK